MITENWDGWHGDEQQAEKEGREELHCEDDEFNVSFCLYRVFTVMVSKKGLIGVYTISIFCEYKKK